MRKQVLVLILLATLVTKAQAEGQVSGQSLLDRFSWSPEYGREKLHQMNDAILALKIEDADFFGVFKNGKWVKPPMLDYAYQSPALHEVEAAAKAGDYEKAASALLAYFKAREAKPGKKPTKKLPADLIAADCFYAAGKLKEIGEAGGPGLFKRDGCTARECVEMLKTVVRLGIQFCSGYAPNPNINSLGGNWIPFCHDLMISVAATWPELTDSKRWIEKSLRYWITNLKYVINDDGSYIEHTFGYPRVVLPNLLALRDSYLAHQLSVPDWYGKQVHRFARYLMFNSLPNGWGIEWGEGHMGDSRPNLAAAARYFNDPELIWWSTMGKEGHPPVALDVHYPQSKNCVFRSSWGEDANFLFFAPRAAGSHFHKDQNMIELYAFGQRLLGDTGMCSYDRTDPPFHWLREMTRSHNTVEVDEDGFPRRTREKDGPYEPGDEGGPCGLVVSSSPRAGFAQGWGGGYPTVRHERDVFFIRETGLCVVRDLLKPSDTKVHTYDQCWHLVPINHYKSDPGSCRVWTTNKDAANLDMISVVPDKPELLLRDGWNMWPRPKTNTIHPSFRQKTAGDAEFVTVIRPTPKDSTSRDCKVEQVNGTKGDLRAIRIATAEGMGILLMSRSKGMVEAAEVKTDADCAYVQFDAKGAIAWAVRKGGSLLTVGGKAVVCEAMVSVGPPALP